MGQLVPPEQVFPESKMGTAVSLKAKPQKSLSFLQHPIGDTVSWVQCGRRLHVGLNTKGQELLAVILEAG